MIKALLFDFFNTLSRYEPPREQMYIDVCARHGIQLDMKQLNQSLPHADTFYRDENHRLPVTGRPQKDQIAFFITYIKLALKDAGIDVDEKICMEILQKMQTIKWQFKLFDDVLPTLEKLKEHKYILGLISNVGQEAEKTFNDLGLLQYLDFYVTSFETGHDKPDPEIFLTALKKARIKANEAIYTGDSYEQDITGARGVGMHPVLIDRNNWFTEITDCPRIRNLSEIFNYIQVSGAGNI
jgi:REG-2-like HAD superfamily hydrolase